MTPSSMVLTSCELLVTDAVAVTVRGSIAEAEIQQRDSSAQRDFVDACSFAAPLAHSTSTPYALLQSSIHAWSVAGRRFEHTRTQRGPLDGLETRLSDHRIAPRNTSQAVSKISTSVRASRMEGEHRSYPPARTGNCHQTDLYRVKQEMGIPGYESAARSANYERAEAGISGTRTFEGADSASLPFSFPGVLSRPPPSMTEAASQVAARGYTSACSHPNPARFRATQTRPFELPAYPPSFAMAAAPLRPDEPPKTTSITVTNHTTPFRPFPAAVIDTDELAPRLRSSVQAPSPIHHAPVSSTGLASPETVHSATTTSLSRTSPAAPPPISRDSPGISLECGRGLDHSRLQPLGARGRESILTFASSNFGGGADEGEARGKVKDEEPFRPARDGSSQDDDEDVVILAAKPFGQTLFPPLSELAKQPLETTERSPRLSTGGSTDSSVDPPSPEPGGGKTSERTAEDKGDGSGETEPENERMTKRRKLGQLAAGDVEDRQAISRATPSDFVMTDAPFVDTRLDTDARKEEARVDPPHVPLNLEQADAETSGDDEASNPQQNGSEPPPGWVLQTVTCYKRRKKDTPFERAIQSRMCRPCRSHRTGFTCSFQNLRFVRQDSSGDSARDFAYFRNGPDVLPTFPTGPDFNEPFTLSKAEVLKSVASEKLLPTMTKELEHAQRRGCRRVTRDVSVINTCDTCLHIILCGSWICANCGTEVCFDCHTTMMAVEKKARGGDANELAEFPKVWLDRLVRCTHVSKHETTQLVPLTRIDVGDLERTVQEMTAWRRDHPIEPVKDLPPGWIDSFFHQPHEEENSLPYLVLPANLLGSSTGPAPRPTTPVRSASTSSDPLDTLLSPPLPVPSLPDGFSTLDLFRALWSRGEAMVVDIDLSQVSSVEWSPEYFVKHFGSEKVTIASNLAGRRDHVETVASFFSRFGRAGGFLNGEKIKDWPPSTDFRKSFPKLWQDYMQMLPIGAVTRRDGVLNISTHTPHNANPPDLGPKGYFSEISDDTEGGQGSTKLHTVNVLLWSSTGPQQSPGFAVWDLYRAEDADKIREFLYELLAERYYDGDVARARMAQDDPIHTQRFFLDQKLRKELWHKKGVRSWRIQQKPGQCVFIPAGCAHQVCNFADCIKVASDFVSIENVGRCWKVTDEFRQQTKEQKLWRSDVLGLKCQLLWAWESAKRLDAT